MLNVVVCGPDGPQYSTLSCRSLFLQTISSRRIFFFAPSSVDHRYGNVENGRLKTRHSTILDIAALNVSEYNIRLRQILSVKNLNVGIGENRAYQQTGYCNEHHPGLETLPAWYQWPSYRPDQSRPG